MQVRYSKSAYDGSLIEVDGKGLVSPNRWLGVYEHVFPEVDRTDSNEISL